MSRLSGMSDRKPETAESQSGPSSVPDSDLNGDPIEFSSSAPGTTQSQNEPSAPPDPKALSQTGPSSVPDSDLNGDTVESHSSAPDTTQSQSEPSASPDLTALSRTEPNSGSVEELERDLQSFMRSIFDSTLANLESDLTNNGGIISRAQTLLQADTAAPRTSGFPVEATCSAIDALAGMTKSIVCQCIDDAREQVKEQIRTRFPRIHELALAYFTSFMEWLIQKFQNFFAELNEMRIRVGAASYMDVITWFLGQVRNIMKLARGRFCTTAPYSGAILPMAVLYK